ncbi:MAG: beta strand repeat-containing protein, partial [Campylobacter sp.]|uniref:beta strand repeat-containing protein n=1 Tax=Campylobacter sp. TaxID=205 RepID=UPI0036135FC9
VEAVTINALSGVNKLTGFISDHVGSSDDSSIKTIKVKGSAELEITGPSSLQTFDASAYTGNKLTANLKANGSVQHIIGSSQDDTFNVTGATGAIIPINGGAGRDTVNINSVIGGNRHVEMSGVEELNVNVNTSVANLDFTRAQEIDTLGVKSNDGYVPQVIAINSKIKTVNVDAGTTSASETKIGIQNAPTFENLNIKNSRSTTLTAEGSNKLNVNIDTAKNFTDISVNSSTIRELNYNVEKVDIAPTGLNMFVNNATALEKIKIVNKTDKAFGHNLDGSNTGNLKILDIETKGNYGTSTNPLKGLSLINLKGTGENTSVTLAQVGTITDGRYPLQGTQDITLNAQNLKDLSVAASSKIITTRNVSLTSTTDKEDATVTYGQIGESATAKANDVNINATGQKTLTTGNIYANGDVNLTTKFTQEGSSATFGASGGAINARNLTINHSTNSDITDGNVTLRGAVAISGSLNANISDYKSLDLDTSVSSITVGGAVNLNTTATRTGSEAKFKSITGATNGINITASALNGINDAEVTYKAIVANEKDINLNFTNMHKVTLNDYVRANGTTATTKGNINITISSTSVTDGEFRTPDGLSAPAGVIRSEKGDVTIKASGQKTLLFGSRSNDASVFSGDGDINIDISANRPDATATFKGEIQSTNKNITIKANGFSELMLTPHSGIGGHINAPKGNLSISTGTNDYLQKVEIGLLTARTMDLDFSNVIAPVNSHVTMLDRNKILLESQDNLNFKGYAGNDVTWIYHVIEDLDATASNENKDFVANVTNAKGSITNASTTNNFTETITLKGGITNPDSILAANPGRDDVTSMSVKLNNMTKIKSVDVSEYNNASGITNIESVAANTLLTTIKGSVTRDNITIGSTGVKTVDTGTGDDKVTFNATQTNDVTVNLGAGNDTITTAALTANKKFEISGGAGNDKFKLAASTTTDNTASKYVTITDASRGD